MPHPVAATKVELATAAAAAAAADTATAAAADTATAGVSAPTPAASTAARAGRPAGTLFVTFSRIFRVAAIKPAAETDPCAVPKDNSKGANASAGTGCVAAAGLLFVLRQELAEDLHLMCFVGSA